MSSYEGEIRNKIESKERLPAKLELNVIKYFWQASPLSGTRKITIPKYLRSIEVFKDFTDNELRILSQYLHLRSFFNNEKIFSQDDLGIGCYFIYSGRVDIVVDKSQGVEGENEVNYVLSLEQGDYFGELALLQENSIRSASAIAKDYCELVGIFKPDIEEMVNDYPIVATKLIQAVAVIIANRMFSLTKEVRRLTFKNLQLEKEHERLIKS